MSSDAYIKIGSLVLHGWQAETLAAFIVCSIFGGGVLLGYAVGRW